MYSSRDVDTGLTSQLGWCSVHCSFLVFNETRKALFRDFFWFITNDAIRIITFSFRRMFRIYSNFQILDTLHFRVLHVSKRQHLFPSFSPYSLCSRLLFLQCIDPFFFSCLLSLCTVRLQVIFLCFIAECVPEGFDATPLYCQTDGWGVIQKP